MLVVEVEAVSAAYYCEVVLLWLMTMVYAYVMSLRLPLGQVRQLAVDVDVPRVLHPP